MKNSENAASPASETAMLSGRHCRLSGKDAHARRNPPNNSSSTRILQVHHAPRQNGVTRLVPTVRTAESAVNSWAYELMNDNNLPEAISLLKLNAQSYPDSGNVYDSLGEAYMKSGQKQLAIENYKKSLEKDPSNDNAQQKLKDLEGSTPAAK
jgi:tetratricopeptide (TPR) repeat protein